MNRFNFKTFLLLFVTLLATASTAFVVGTSQTKTEKTEETGAYSYIGDQVTATFTISSGGTVWKSSTSNDASVEITGTTDRSNDVGYGTHVKSTFLNFDGWAFNKMVLNGYTSNKTKSTNYNISFYTNYGASVRTYGTYSSTVSDNSFSQSFTFTDDGWYLHEGDYVVLDWWKSSAGATNYLKSITFTLTRFKDPNLVQGVSLPDSNITLDVSKNERYQLTPNIAYLGHPDISYSVSFSNNQVAYLSSNGVTIIPYVKGVTTVTVTMNFDSNLTASMTINVIDTREGYVPNTPIFDYRILTGYSASISTFNNVPLVMFCNGTTTLMTRSLTADGNYENDCRYTAVERNDKIAIFIPEPSGSYFRLRLYGTNSYLQTNSSTSSVVSWTTNPDSNLSLWYIGSSNKYLYNLGSGYTLRNNGSGSLVMKSSGTSTSTYPVMWPRSPYISNYVSPSYFWTYFKNETDRICSSLSSNPYGKAPEELTLLYRYLRHNYYKNHTTYRSEITSSTYNTSEYIQRYKYIVNKYSDLEDVLGLRSVSTLPTPMLFKVSENSNVGIVCVVSFTTISLIGVLFIKKRKEI